MKTRLTLAVALGLLLTVGVLYLAGHNPQESGHIYPKCVFKWATGFHCAGCGSTRAAYALVHFEVWEAFRKNPLVIILLPFVGIGAVLEGAAWILGDRYRGPRAKLPAGGTWVLLGVILSFWVLRNIPVWPFSLMAPH